MNGWMNLGIACLRLLGEHNPQIWGYLTLLCLKYPNDSRKDQAEFCLLRALKLLIEDDNLLEEIGDIYADKKPDFAIA
eukprot:CAMPEP_0168327252 /NCGR_PEP_ID=MMETSP0213-20121227/5794_1 /TAXON_ID=151035 /ORGANISM="Euplotes harpa, Strain FSP1.4" /LENGTH=77 /DNA_ID=CAMNT_0008330135 /DNA_START=64 /DNA_END=297 /DNA_ORIENTATION=+